jgi:hypothetical protein
MTSKEVCDILKASKGLNLKKIKIKDLIIEFGDLTNSDSVPNNSTNAIPNATIGQIEPIKYLEEEVEPKIDEIKDEFVMANLMASQPEEYEKALRNIDG